MQAAGTCRIQKTLVELPLPEIGDYIVVRLRPKTMRGCRLFDRQLGKVTGINEMTIDVWTMKGVTQIFKDEWMLPGRSHTQSVDLSVEQWKELLDARVVAKG